MNDASEIGATKDDLLHRVWPQGAADVHRGDGVKYGCLQKKRSGSRLHLSNIGNCSMAEQTENVAHSPIILDTSLVTESHDLIT